MTDPEFVTRVLRIFYEVDAREDLLWNVRDGKVSFAAMCSDIFCWACADAEDITPENVGRLEVAIADVQAATGTSGWSTPGNDAALLFVARERKLRPQGAAYKYRDAALWPLFDAAGPERTVGTTDPGNTPKPAPQT